jgi:hypothetical protein
MKSVRRQTRTTSASPPERKWGRFASRTNGPQPYRPVKEESESGSRGKPDRVRVNAMTPQPHAEQSQPRGQERRRHGRKISRAKREQLRAAGKRFQCEEKGHDQRNCPKLYSVRRPTVNVNNIDLVCLKRLSVSNNAADIRVGAMSFETEGATDDATWPMRRANELCALEWGDDDAWRNVATRAESRYNIYQYSTGSSSRSPMGYNQGPGT